jgi:hypothetical protein
VIMFKPQAHSMELFSSFITSQRQLSKGFASLLPGHFPMDGRLSFRLAFGPWHIWRDIGVWDVTVRGKIPLIDAKTRERKLRCGISGPHAVVPLGTSGIQADLARWAEIFCVAFRTPASDVCELTTLHKETNQAILT